MYFLASTVGAHSALLVKLIWVTQVINNQLTAHTHNPLKHGEQASSDVTRTNSVSNLEAIVDMCVVVDDLQRHSQILEDNIFNPLRR